MAIRKPAVSVAEARQLSKIRPTEASMPDRVPATVSSDVPVSVMADHSSAALVSTVPPETGRSRSGAQTARRLSAAAVSTLSKPAAAGHVPLPASGRPASRVSAGEPLAVFPEDLPAEPKIQVFVSAPLPASGVSASFDALSRRYPCAKTLQMILRRALDAYELRLEDGSCRTLPQAYPIAGAVEIVQTSRMMPVRLVEIARAHFDPLGFESARAFGRKLACAALAAFFEAEKQFAAMP